MICCLFLSLTFFLMLILYVIKFISLFYYCYWIFDLRHKYFPYFWVIKEFIYVHSRSSMDSIFLTQIFGPSAIFPF